MLFVDHDQSKVLKRQEQGGACANDQPGLAIGRGHPDPATLGLGDPGMPFTGPCAEPLFHALKKLDSQGDFRQQDKRLAPLAQNLCHSFEIDFRFARTCDAL